MVDFILADANRNFAWRAGAEIVRDCLGSLGAYRRGRRAAARGGRSGYGRRAALCCVVPLVGSVTRIGSRISRTSFSRPASRAHHQGAEGLRRQRCAAGGTRGPAEILRDETGRQGRDLAPKAIRAAKKGDDSLLRFISAFARMRAEKPSAWPRPRRRWWPAKVRLARKRPATNKNPTSSRRSGSCMRLVRWMWARPLLVCEVWRLAVEAAEGTDAMLARIGQLARKCARHGRQKNAACW